MECRAAVDELDDGGRRSAGRRSSIEKQIDTIAQRDRDTVCGDRGRPSRQIGTRRGDAVAKCRGQPPRDRVKRNTNADGASIAGYQRGQKS